MSDGNKITYFGLTDFRNERKRFGIKNKDRARHVYVIGKTGMGKSTLLENMAAQDIQNGEGMCFIDPHGSAIETLLDYIPEHRIKDVVYFAPFDSEHPIAFNVMEDIDSTKRHLVVSGLMSTFKKIWVDAWSARMEYILNNTILALLEYPNSTLLSVNRMLSDKGFREEVVSHVKDPSVRAFWVDEFANYTERMQAESVPAIQNKIGQFTANPLIRNIIGQPVSSFSVRDMMDNQKIFLVNLSKGQIGEQNAALLGGMIITAIYLGAMSRADVPKSELAKLPDFYLFVDEFQNFANESFADILAEARKYKLALTVAHQYIAQMDEPVADAVFGNVGTTISYRVGPMDAEVLEKVFAPVFIQEDIVNLGRFQFYLSLMIDDVGSRPFSATGIGPLEKPEISYRTNVIDSSRTQFAKPRAEVEQFINDWHGKQYETNKEKKQTEKRFQKMREKGFTIPGEEEKPSKIVIPLDIQNSLVTKEPEVVKKEDTAAPIISRISIPVEQPKKDTVYSKPQAPQSIQQKYPAKVYKPKTEPIKKEIPSQVKDFIQTVEAPKESVLQKPPVVSRFSKKEASDENKNALRDALSAALKNSQIKQQATKEPQHILEKPTQVARPSAAKKAPDRVSLQNLVLEAEELLKKHTKQKDDWNTFDTKIHYEENNSSSGTVKEVPEDVLRSILE